MKRSLKILLMKSPGFIAPHVMERVACAFERAGSSVLRIDFEERGLLSAKTREEELARANAALAAIRSFAPDFALSYAFGGAIATADGNIFESLKIPYLLLFYDSPAEQPESFERLSGSTLLNVLCWDKARIPWLEARGVERILHQPLGTDAALFGAAKARGMARNLAFAGSLPACASSANPPGEGPLKEFSATVLALKRETPCRSFEELLNEAESGLGEGAKKAFRAFRATPAFLRYKQALMAFADAVYRTSAIKELAPFEPEVFGGGAWRATGVAKISDGVPYGPQLAELYAASAINLNLSNSHLLEAVNQRPFDCAAAGGFLLSDWRAEAEELFDPEKEIPLFKNFEEMKALVERFSKDEAARKRMAEAAKRRALACHTWDKRVVEMTEWLLKNNPKLGV